MNTDPLDCAADLQELANVTAVALHGRRPAVAARSDCLDCAEPIPAARRAERVRSRIDLVGLVRESVELKRSGRGEWQGLCPFHTERTPSFTVSEDKQFFHCFGCRAHGDVFGWVMLHRGVDFPTAVAELSGDVPRRFERVHVPAAPGGAAEVYVPLMPVPDDAPRLSVGVPVALANPKRGRRWRMTPSRVDAYRNAQGQLLGYVLREDLPDGRKLPTQATWCVAPDGTLGWAAVPFPEPRPLLGLDDLAARPEAKVLLVSGEKCRALAAQKLVGLVVMTWPGGDGGFKRVDWMPLMGRHVLLWNDADLSGLRSMIGWEEQGVRQGQSVPVWHDGIAHKLAEIRVGSLSYIDLDQDPVTGLAPGLPQGWDVGDAIAAGWPAAQLVAWMRAKARTLTLRPEERGAA